MVQKTESFLGGRLSIRNENILSQFVSTRERNKNQSTKYNSVIGWMGSRFKKGLCYIFKDEWN